MVAGQEDAVRAEADRLRDRHGRADAVRAGLVAGGGDHTAPAGPPADDDRLAPQLRPAQDLGGGEEGVEVGVDDDPRPVRRDAHGAAPLLGVRRRPSLSGSSPNPSASFNVGAWERGPGNVFRVACFVFRSFPSSLAGSVRAGPAWYGMRGISRSTPPRQNRTSVRIVGQRPYAVKGVTAALPCYNGPRRCRMGRGLLWIRLANR